MADDFLDVRSHGFARVAVRVPEVRVADPAFHTDDLLFNCAVTLFRGRAVAVAPKAFPPNYREFYERRWFHPAANARSTEIPLLGERVPFGTDVLVAAPRLPGFVLHTDICEDLWTPVPPGTLAALAGATVLANLSASNVTVGKWAYRQEL